MYYFESKKIEIVPARDKWIQEKGKFRTQKDKNGKTVIEGSGIYDFNLFKEIREYEEENGMRINAYMKLNVKSPSKLTNYSIFGHMSKDVEALLTYKAFMYAGSIVEEGLDGNFNFFDFVLHNDNLFYFGEEAVLLLLRDKLDQNKRMSDAEKEAKMKEYKDWLRVNNTEYFIIPDISFRKPILPKDGKIQDPEINSFYKNLFEINEENTLAFEIEGMPKFTKFFSARNIHHAKDDTEQKLYDYLAKGKSSLVKKEGVAEKLCGGARVTIIPAPYVPEDKVEIGTMFGNYLYPQFTGLWKNAEELNFLISRGVITPPKDIYEYDASKFLPAAKIIKHMKGPEAKFYKYYFPWWPSKYNFIPEEELKKIKEEVNKKRWEFYKTHQSDTKYLVIIDRNPTICILSMISFEPVFVNVASREMKGDANERIVGKSAYTMNSFKKYEGMNDYDIDFYPEDTLALNPLVCSGMNADFDGDIALVIPLWTKEANEEAKRLLATNNYMNIDSETIRNNIPKEFKFEMKKIYESNPALAEKIHNLINS